MQCTVANILPLALITFHTSVCHRSSVATMTRLSLRLHLIVSRQVTYTNACFKHYAGYTSILQRSIIDSTSSYHDQVFNNVCQQHHNTLDHLPNPTLNPPPLLPLPKHPPRRQHIRPLPPLQSQHPLNLHSDLPEQHLRHNSHGPSGRAL